MELQLEEVQAAVAEDETALDGEMEGLPARKPIRCRQVRGPLPAHLPRERVVIPGPTCCPCCQGKLSKLGEDVTETLEVVPRHWKVVQTVRERMACRACDAVSQPPAPFHPIARGRAGPELLATILEAKFGQHVARAPLAAEAVRRIDAIFDVERSINGLPAEQRLAIRQKHVAPLVADLETWMRAARGKMSRHAEVAKAMDHMLKRWDTFSRFLGDGRICLSNNAAERALRGVALGRKSWLFCGSDRGGDRAAAMYSLIVTAKLNNTDPRAWLADVLRRINNHPASRLHELLPWNWHKPGQHIAAAA